MDEAQLTMLQNEDDCVRKEEAHVWLPRNEQAALLRRADLVRPIPGQRAETPPAPAVRCAVFIPLQGGGLHRAKEYAALFFRLIRPAPALQLSKQDFRVGNLLLKYSFLCAPSYVMQDSSIGQSHHQTSDAVLCRPPQGKAGLRRHPHLKLSSMLKRPARSWCTREALKSRHPMDSCGRHGKLLAHVTRVSGLSQNWVQSA